MATVGELRATLTAKGYSSTASSGSDLSAAPLITVHTHPLLSSPVILIGADANTAKPYQSSIVAQATTRR